MNRKSQIKFPSGGNWRVGVGRDGRTGENTTSVVVHESRTVPHPPRVSPGHGRRRRSMVVLDTKSPLGNSWVGW